jgi:hypothetical protein
MPLLPRKEPPRYHPGVVVIAALGAYLRWFRPRKLQHQMGTDAAQRTRKSPLSSLRAPVRKPTAFIARPTSRIRRGRPGSATLLTRHGRSPPKTRYIADPEVLYQQHRRVNDVARPRATTTLLTRHRCSAWTRRPPVAASAPSAPAAAATPPLPATSSTVVRPTAAIRQPTPSLATATAQLPPFPGRRHAATPGRRHPAATGNRPHPPAAATSRRRHTAATGNRPRPPI